MDLAKVGAQLQQVGSLVGIVVPAVQSIVGVVLQLAQQAQQRGWDVDTTSLQETAARFDAIAEAARAEKAKYQGQ